MSYNFVNPYNFVPLSGESPIRKDFTIEGDKQAATSEKLLTGKIEYTIETLTPLFIPNTSNDKAFDVHIEGDKSKENDKTYHHSYDFFSYDDISEGMGEVYHENDFHEPVIPGSEIRGAVRSVFESLTNSCLSSVDMDVKFSKRTPECFQAGVLVRTGDVYSLYPAEDCIYRCDEEPDGRWKKKYYNFVKDENGNAVADGQEIYFEKIIRRLERGVAKPIAINLSTKEHGKSRVLEYLMKGQPGPEMDDKKQEKHNAHIFSKKQEACAKWDTAKEADKKVYKGIKERLDAIIKIYLDNADNKSTYGEYAKTWNAFKSKKVDAIPVYYSAVGKIYYFSPACITREVYAATMSSLLGNHKPCVSDKELCPACVLFGAVQDKLKVASKLRFSDAYVKDSKNPQDYYLDIVSLQELSMPKLSSTEFYLRRPGDNKNNIMNWTYDYYVVRDKNGNVETKLYTPTLAGRKFYWHSNKLGNGVIKHAEMKPDKEKKIIINTERNRTIRPLKSGEAFKGELYFEGITAEQLQQLVAIMNLSNYNCKEDGSTRYAIKLGSAKPLGLGSVSLKVNSVLCRELSCGADNTFAYNSVEVMDDYNKLLDVVFEGNTDILKILDLNAVGADMIISYPKNDSADEGFKWFGDNKIKYEYKKGQLNTFRQTKSPSKRIQIEYAQYMEALNPKLKGTPNVSGGYGSGGGGQRSGGNGGHKPNGNYGGKPGGYGGHKSNGNYGGKGNGKPGGNKPKEERSPSPFDNIHFDN